MKRKIFWNLYLKREKSFMLPDFDKAFMCDKKDRRRCAIYVNDETRKRLYDVVRLIGNKRVSVAGYIENIIDHHFEQYKDEINRLNRSNQTPDIL